MRTRRIVLLVLAVGDLVARFVLGLPGAFAVLGTVAIVGIPMCLAFMVAEECQQRRSHELYLQRPELASGVRKVSPKFAK